ncbi:MAG: hypothetical protein ACI4LD_03780, partial [Lentihominibacter sp.]
IVVITYPIVKISLGGLNNSYPELFPKNDRTKMAYGDMYRIAKLMLIIGALAVFGYFAFQVIEGGWGPEYYAYMYGSGLLSNFDAMRMTLLIGGLICILIAAVIYLIGRKNDKKMLMPTELMVSVGKHSEDTDK